jgi:hypothetical protein
MKANLSLAGKTLGSVLLVIRLTARRLEKKDSRRPPVALAANP